MRPQCEDVQKEDAETTEWREKKRAYDRLYRARHKDRINERRRIRIQNDPAYREKRLAAKREHYQRHKEEIREHCKEKWRTDPDYRAKSRARCRITMRKKRFKGYGITLDQYEQMFALQGGACATCRKTGVTLCVDHCHRTGEIRGLLCRRCNIALGYCDDDPDILLAAVAYLQTWRDQQREAHGTDPPIEPASQGRPEGLIGQPCDGSMTAHSQVHAGRTVAPCRADRARNIVAAAAKPYESGVT